MQDKQLHTWREWYTFARDELGMAREEATEYANHRYAEELNRASANGDAREHAR